MGIDREPAEGSWYRVVTSTTRPTTPSEGMLIFEQDTGKLMKYIDAGFWWEVDPRGDFGSVTLQAHPGSVIGSNDFAGAGYTSVILSQSITVPSGAAALSYDMTFGLGVITSPANWDVRLAWGAAVLEEYLGILGAATLLTIRFRGSFSTTPATNTFNLQVRRISGTGALRQSVSFYAGEVWFPGLAA